MKRKNTHKTKNKRTLNVKNGGVWAELSPFFTTFYGPNSSGNGLEAQAFPSSILHKLYAKII